MDQATTALGGDPALHADPQTSADACVPPGERAGEAIGQLQKVALEVYSPTLIPLDPTKAGLSGAFLATVGDCVQTLCPTTARTLFPVSSDPSPEVDTTSAPMVEDVTPTTAAPMHPIPIRPSASRRNSSSTVIASDDDSTNHGGKVVKRRTSASSLSKPTSVANGKKRTSSTDGSSGRPAVSEPDKPASLSSGGSARWSIQIPENAVWTLVGVESIRHTFFLPSGERDGDPGAITGPVTPLVAVSRYLPPGTKVVNDPHERGYEATFVNGTQEQMITV